jgi:hypothetical protein
MADANASLIAHELSCKLAGESTAETLTMRRRFWIFIALAILAATGVPAPAATFQNLDFEAYPGAALPGSATMPSWQLVDQLGDGTVIYQNEQPGLVYPFLGFHIGDGPVIGVNGVVPQLPNRLQGNFSITLIPQDPGAGIVPTESAALARKAQVQEGGLAQTAEVPAWARSVWIATLTSYPSLVDMSFSNHRVELGLATAAQATQMLAQAALDPPSGLENPLLLPPNDPSINFLAGNIEPIAGRTRELKILPELGISYLGGLPNPFGYYVNAQPITFDMIVFSPLPWDGPAVTVPEPQSMLVLLTAIPAIWLRRRAIA